MDLIKAKIWFAGFIAGIFFILVTLASTGVKAGGDSWNGGTVARYGWYGAYEQYLYPEAEYYVAQPRYYGYGNWWNGNPYAYSGYYNYYRPYYRGWYGGYPRWNGYGRGWYGRGHYGAGHWRGYGRGWGRYGGYGRWR